MAAPPLSRAPSPWSWAVLIGLSLLAPAGLPAGGAQLGGLQPRRRQHRQEPLVMPAAAPLRSAPAGNAPAVACVAGGTPLRVLRRWWDPRGRCWLHVEAVVASAAGGRARRGWLPG
jgi:hypothetical protein